MVFCFGELLLRMSPALKREWIKDNALPVYVGGAELNVATALSGWKIPSRYSTALPDNYLSAEIIEDIAARGIDSSAILLSGNRIGIYYLPQGADLKNAGVIYDRAHSSFSELMPGMVDWEKAFEGCSWFHLSAISPAINTNVAAVCKEALVAATKKGLQISIDLNYRSKLWKYGKQPVEVMPELVQYCHVVMGNIWSAADLLGVSVDANIHDKKSKEAYLDHAGETSMAIKQRFESCHTVANTFRFDAGNGIRYFATLDIKDGQFVSPEFNTEKVVDKVGSGDCFMAGLIYGLYKNKTAQEVIDFAAAAAFGKLQEKGDATKQHESDIKYILDEQKRKLNRDGRTRIL